MITVNGVAGKEMWEAHRKGRAEGGPYVELSYLVEDYSSADQFIDGCIGGIISSGGRNGQLRNVPKLECPTNPGLYALTAEYSGRGEANAGANGRPTFKAAVVTVHFGVPMWPEFPRDDPGGQQAFVNESVPNQPIIRAECEIDIANEVLTVPSAAFVFESDLAAITYPVPKRNSIATFRVTRHYFPNLPYAKVMSLCGKVNSVKMFDQPAECVLFDSARTKLIMTADGTRTQSWEMIFLVKTRSWNQFLRPDTGVFDAIVDKHTELFGPYRTADLLPLIN